MSSTGPVDVKQATLRAKLLRLVAASQAGIPALEVQASPESVLTIRNQEFWKSLVKAKPSSSLDCA